VSVPDECVFIVAGVQDAAAVVCEPTAGVLTVRCLDALLEAHPAAESTAAVAIETMAMLLRMWILRGRSGTVGLAGKV